MPCCAVCKQHHKETEPRDCWTTCMIVKQIEITKTHVFRPIRQSHGGDSENKDEDDDQVEVDVQSEKIDR